MSELVPTRFLFRFEIPIRRMPAPPPIDGHAERWSEAHLLPDLHEIEGQRGFARVWVGWHESGLYLGCRVSGKLKPLQCDPARFWKGDNIRLMTDMRDARDVRRATRFCQQFFFLPTGGGRDRRQAVGGSHRIQRAQADAPQVKGDLPVAANVVRGGYSLTAHVPAEALSGFAPTENARIGIYTMVEDTELGQQYLTVGDDLSWYYDPSTWATGVLVD